MGFAWISSRLSLQNSTEAHATHQLTHTPALWHKVTEPSLSHKFRFKTALRSHWDATGMGRQQPLNWNDNMQGFPFLSFVLNLKN